ncbi:MAG: hypothetical protein EOO88_42165 [Pedobacter sp.]|nr:MAG: hypothetical protein EOO88_42165 [Pedobacter sp.]
MSKFLQISIYRRPGDRASLVFRKNGVLYRITTIERAKLFARQLDNYEYDLKKDCAKTEFIMQISSPRRRNWVIEIGLKGEGVTLKVYEALNGFMKLQFEWNGNKAALIHALEDFSVATHFAF